MQLKQSMNSNSGGGLIFVHSNPSLAKVSTKIGAGYKSKSKTRIAKSHRGKFEKIAKSIFLKFQPDSGVHQKISGFIRGRRIELITSKMTKK